MSKPFDAAPSFPYRLAAYRAGDETGTDMLLFGIPATGLERLGPGGRSDKKIQLIAKDFSLLPGGLACAGLRWNLDQGA